MVSTAVVFAGLYSCYRFMPSVHSIFVNNPADTAQVMGQVAADSGRSVASHKEFIGFIVFCIFAAMISLQVFIFGITIIITKGIMKQAGNAAAKLKRLDNAGIFFDLPLYSGLFGTVASFMVISFSRESSLLIAYSTTLIGIVSSVFLHVALLYPAKRKLLSENNN